MPLAPTTFQALCSGLRTSATSGEFVPRYFVERIEEDDGGSHFFCCGWGHVARIIAMLQHGDVYAKRMLPEESGWDNVKIILLSAGVTAQEIDRMTPELVWQEFDERLETAYDNREEDPDTYILKSKLLAEMFIKVLQRVPLSIKREYVISNPVTMPLAA